MAKARFGGVRVSRRVKRVSRTTRPAPHHPWLLLGGLILAGESIYMLPYLRKSFQTTMELTFGLNALEIGSLNALFGVLAVLCYLPGGWVADRFSARRLLTFSLLCTGLGGFYMASVPGYVGLLLLHAFWGICSILTFWAALIKATRLWSPAHAQGRAFGVLDGGRGAVAALLASLGALCFGLSQDPQGGLVNVVLLYSVASLASACVVWWLLPEDPPQVHGSGAGHIPAASLWAVLRLRSVWLIGIIIFCAYFLYLGSFEFPAYAERALERSKQFGAWLGAFRDWLRPVAAIGAGLLADRVSASRAIGWLFALLVAVYTSLALLPADITWLALFWVQVATTAIAVFALRGIFFALLEECRIPLHLTGLAVGVVSMVGYLPDVIAPVLAGGLVDRFPGALGYQVYFAVLALLGGAGFCAARILLVDSEAGAG